MDLVKNALVRFHPSEFIYLLKFISNSFTTLEFDFIFNQIHDQLRLKSRPNKEKKKEKKKDMN